MKKSLWLYFSVLFLAVSVIGIRADDPPEDPPEPPAYEELPANLIPASDHGYDLNPVNIQRQSCIEQPSPCVTEDQCYVYCEGYDETYYSLKATEVLPYGLCGPEVINNDICIVDVNPPRKCAGIVLYTGSNCDGDTNYADLLASGSCFVLN